MTSLNKQTGFSLIEVLITFLILAVGLLGVAGLQTVGMRNNHNALLRSHASFLAYELVDYMRINTLGVAADAYAITAGTGSTPPIPATTANCATGTCSPAQAAAFNLNRWFTNLMAALPNASATIVCVVDIDTTDGDPCTAGSLIRITVNWDESTTQTGNVTQSFTTEVEL